MTEIDIPLVEVEDVKTGRGGGRRGTGQKYAKYADALSPLIEFFDKAIAASKDGTIRMKNADLARQMGMSKHETSIYWGVKFQLFQKGIFVTTGQTKVGEEPILIMRKKKEGDVLPASLAKHLSGAEGPKAAASAEE